MMRTRTKLAQKEGVFTNSLNAEINSSFNRMIVEIGESCKKNPGADQGCFDKGLWFELITHEYKTQLIT